MNKSLYDAIRDWLAHKLINAERLKYRSLCCMRDQLDDYTRGQYRYAANQVSVINWLISQVPKRFKRVKLPDHYVITDLCQIVDAVTNGD